MENKDLLKFIRDMKKTVVKHSDPDKRDELNDRYDDFILKVKGNININDAKLIG